MLAGSEEARYRKWPAKLYVLTRECRFFGLYATEEGCEADLEKCGVVFAPTDYNIIETEVQT